MVASISPATNIDAGSASPRLSYRTKILYGCGDIANMIKTIVFGLFTLYFYTSVMGLPGTWVGIASAIGLAWDALISPYIGYLSDNAHYRLGRRHTFMLLGVVTMGLCFWAFLSPPQDLATPALFAWLLGWSILVRTATAVYGVPYLALGAELSEDYDERTNIAAVRGLLALLGTLVAAALSFVVFFPGTTPGIDPKLNYAGYPAMGLTFGLLMSLTGAIALAGTLGRRPYLTHGHPGATAGVGRGLWASLLKSLRNPSFRAVLVAFSLCFLGLVVNSTLSIHYYTFYIQITDSAVLSGFQLAFYLGGLAGILFWLGASRRIEKQWICLVATLAIAMLFLGALLLFGEGHLFGAGYPLPFTVGQALAGFFGSILWFMPNSMIADVADEDEFATGQRREGSFFGIFSFGQRLAAGLSSLVAGVLVDWYAGLVPGQAQQSALTVQRLAVLYSVLPAVLFCAATVIIARYPLSRSRVAAIRADLDRRYAAQRTQPQSPSISSPPSPVTGSGQ